MLIQHGPATTYSLCANWRSLMWIINSRTTFSDTKPKPDCLNARRESVCLHVVYFILSYPLLFLFLLDFFCGNKINKLLLTKRLLWRRYQNWNRDGRKKDGLVWTWPGLNAKAERKYKSKSWLWTWNAPKPVQGVAQHLMSIIQNLIEISWSAVTLFFSDETEWYFVVNSGLAFGSYDLSHFWGNCGVHVVPRMIIWELRYYLYLSITVNRRVLRKINTGLKL